MSRQEQAGERQRESLRAFVAVVPGAPLRDALGGARTGLDRADSAAGLRWMPPENLHLTLRFLGEVPLASLPTLRSALRETLREQSRFHLPFQEIALFPSPRRPRALAAVFPLGESLETLVARVELAVRDSGLPVQARRFRPHITLARFRRGHRASPLPGIQLQAPPLEVDSVALVRSVLTASGARYTTLESFPLTAASGFSR